jgi:hypothetical protein
MTLLLALALSAGPLDVTAIRPVDGPEVLYHAVEGPVVALRLAAPGWGLPEGSMELLQELARPEARKAADAIGARLTFAVEGRTAVLAVTGPVQAFDAMATLLRSASADLDLTVSALRVARARTESRVLAALERPEPRVRRLLWHRLFGGPEPVGPTATLLDPEDVRRVRQRLYDPARIRITVVGDVPPAVIRSAFSHWPSPGTTSGAVEPEGETEPARPQAHREWMALGYPVDADPATLAVAAALVQERLDRSVLRHAEASPWRGPTGWALALVVATDPAGESGGPAGESLRGLIAEATGAAGADSVEAAAAELRSRLLLEARTATGRAAVIGRLADAFGAPDGAARLLADLDDVDARAVEAVLRGARSGPAAFVEAR